MKVFPAIHLLEGKAVRLTKGRRDAATVYSEDPVSLVAGFIAAGAERIHVVDLDGAFTGTPANHELLKGIVEASSVPVQVGGGIRDQEALDAVFATGARYAILGTAAVKNRRFVKKACRDHENKIIVAVDSGEDGLVAIEGWTEKSEKTALEISTRAILWGAASLLFTDIDRDGTMTGPNFQAAAALSHTVDVPVIAAGGVSKLEDLGELAAREVPAVVVGRALYDKVFTLEEAIVAAGEVGEG